MTKVLLTGFEPFGSASSNPSGEIVKQISGDNIMTAILPVAYTQSAERLLALIAEHNPDVVISLGQAEGRTRKPNLPSNKLIVRRRPSGKQR